MDLGLGQDLLGNGVYFVSCLYHFVFSHMCFKASAFSSTLNSCIVIVTCGFNVYSEKLTV